MKSTNLINIFKITTLDTKNKIKKKMETSIKTR